MLLREVGKVHSPLVKPEGYLRAVAFVASLKRTLEVLQKGLLGR